MPARPAIMVFTGSPGPGIITAASAAALAAAQSGQHTLLMSLAPAHSLEALLATELGADPVEVAPRLDALALDPTAELGRVWERFRGQLPSQLARLAADELPLLPGIAVLFGLLRIQELGERYERLVVDAGASDALIQTLMLPDTMRWLVRLLIGLDRGPGRSAASQMQSILPAGFLPSGVVNGAQDTRLEAERIRGALTETGAAGVCFVVRPDAVALAEARLAVAAIQLYGLGVSALAVGPLLPDAGPIAALQQSVLAETHATWASRPVLRLHAPEQHGLAGLRPVAAAFDLAAIVPQAQSPIADTYNGTPALVIALPGLPKGALALTLSGDELVVRVGHYRRHVLLPDGLRGITSIRAIRDGEALVVRRRE